MIKGIGNGIDWNAKQEWFKEHDMVIFRASDEGDDQPLSYGILTCAVFDKYMDDWTFMIALARATPSATVKDYPLLLVYASRVVLPKYSEGKRIAEKQGAGQLSTHTVVDKREVVLDESGKPAYRYHIQVEVQNDQADMLEEELLVLAPDKTIETS